MFCRKRYIEDLKHQNDYLKKQLDGRDANCETLNERLKKKENEKKGLYEIVEMKDKTIEELRDKIEKLEMELNMLYEDYELDKEPSQGVKTLVRINKRVHDLELENMELRLNERNIKERLIKELKDIQNTQINALTNYWNYLYNPASALCQLRDAYRQGLTIL